MGFMVIAHTTRSERMADGVKKTEALVALSFVAGWVCAKCIGTDEYDLLAENLCAADDYIKSQ
jgi:hypothetical protein